jgi:hypothetical protein
MLRDSGKQLQPDTDRLWYGEVLLSSLEDQSRTHKGRTQGSGGPSARSSLLGMKVSSVRIFCQSKSVKLKASANRAQNLYHRGHGGTEDTGRTGTLHPVSAALYAPHQDVFPRDLCGKGAALLGNLNSGMLSVAALRIFPSMILDGFWIRSLRHGFERAGLL